MSKQRIAGQRPTAARGGWRVRESVTIPQILASVALVGLGATAIHAQPVPTPPLPPLDPAGRSGGPSPLEREKPPPLPAPRAAPDKQEKLKPVLPVKVLVRKFDIVGNTVFSHEELETIVAPYVGREITTEELEAVRVALTLHYVKNGFVTSGAIVPDQTVADGVITIQIIEGVLKEIDVAGTEYFRPSYLHKRIELSAGPPVNIHRLQERLQLLQQDPRIVRLNAELRPTVARGESELRVSAKEASPYRAWIEFNNYQAQSVGAARGLGTIAHDNLTGNGDRYTFTYGRSEGLDLLVDTRYSLPLNAYDTTFEPAYRRNNFTIVEDPFQALGLQTQTEAINLTLRQPVYRTLNHDISLALTGEWLFNKVESSVFESLGISTDILTPGSTQTGVNIISALRFEPQWVYRTRDKVVALRSRFTWGLPVLNATVREGPKTGPSGQAIATAEFFAWLGQVQAVQRFDRLGGLQVLLRGDVQLASDHLFPLERYPVGGRYTVRGYRENTLVRDNVLLASVEGRVPVLRYATGEDIVQLAAFADYGSAWENNESSPFPRFLASVGLGLRWNILPRNRAQYEVYWGAQLNHVDQPGDSLQDHGIHMGIVIQLF